MTKDFKRFDRPHVWQVKGRTVRKGLDRKGQEYVGTDIMDFRILARSFDDVVAFTYERYPTARIEQIVLTDIVHHIIDRPDVAEVEAKLEG